MGWCSGTKIFDDVVKACREQLKLSDDQEYTLLLALAQSLEDMDWDCQFDSDYVDDPVVEKVLRTLGHLEDAEDIEEIPYDRQNLALLNEWYSKADNVNFYVYVRPLNGPLDITDAINDQSYTIYASAVGRLRDYWVDAKKVLVDWGGPCAWSNVSDVLFTEIPF